MPVWNDNMEDANQQVDWSLLIQLVLGVYCFAMDTSSALKMRVLQHHSVHAFGMCTIIIFVYLGLQVKWNQFGSNNSHHTSRIHNRVACWEVTWPNDIQTGFCQYAGIPLDRPYWTTTGATSTLGCHWNHTGWCYHPVVSQWRSNVNLHNWNTLEHHWKTTGRPLEAHWKRTGHQQLFLQRHPSVHWGLNPRHTGLPLDYHWITTGSGQ